MGQIHDKQNKGLFSRCVYVYGSTNLIQFDVSDVDDTE